MGLYGETETRGETPEFSSSPTPRMLRRELRDTTVLGHERSSYFCGLKVQGLWFKVHGLGFKAN